MAPRVAVKSKGKGKKKGPNGGSEGEGQTYKAAKEWSSWVAKKVKVVAHYGFVPLVIVIGMNSEPKPQLHHLLSPV